MKIFSTFLLLVVFAISSKGQYSIGAFGNSTLTPVGYEYSAIGGSDIRSTKVENNIIYSESFLFAQVNNNSIGLLDDLPKPKWSVYPNPAIHEITVSVSKEYDVAVFSSSGKKIYQTTITPENNRLIVSHITAKGNYHLVLLDNGRFIDSKKIIIYDY